MKVSVRELNESEKVEIARIDSLPKEYLDYVIQVTKKNPILAIKEIRAKANVSLATAHLWVALHINYIEEELSPCPYCGKPRRTSKAKQCRFCLRDWHDENEMKWLK